MNADRVGYVTALIRAYRRFYSIALATIVIITIAGCSDRPSVTAQSASQPPVKDGAKATSDAHAPIVLEFRGPTMGTAYSVKCWSPVAPALAGNEVQAKVDELLAEVNRQMSTYDLESELSRFNRAAAGECRRNSR